LKQLLVIVLPLVLLWMLASCSFTKDYPPANTVPHTENKYQYSEPPQVTSAVSPTESLPTDPLVTDATVIAEPKASDFVRVLDYIPDLIIDLKYAGTENFTGVAIYDSGEAWLRYGTVNKLIQVQTELKEMGYGLKLWDGFRPPAAQWKLWDICPDPTYVSDPNKGFSNHSRGNTVDITLVDGTGRELEMPTGFDDFSKMATGTTPIALLQLHPMPSFLKRSWKNTGLKATMENGGIIPTVIPMMWSMSLFRKKQHPK